MSRSRGEKKTHDASVTYRHKVEEITKWYNHILANRQEQNLLKQDKKPLKSLSYYIDQIKKPRGE